MRLYSEHPGASIRMQDSGELRTLLRDVVRNHHVTHVLETGTNVGLGSTTFLAEAFAGGESPISFVTIEARWWNWMQARRNLARFPFVLCEWGLSVPRADALAFIRQDEALREHQRYADIFIDDVANPARFYENEIRGGYIGRVLSRTVLAHQYAGDARLTHWCERMRKTRPLIVLDSAGATGLLEFETMRRVMGDAPYLLLLDDTHHLKHFRSVAAVHADRTFRVLGENAADGWLLTSRTPLS